MVWRGIWVNYLHIELEPLKDRAILNYVPNHQKYVT